MKSTHDHQNWKKDVAIALNLGNLAKSLALTKTADIMASSFTWLDYSEQEKQKMLDVISTFSQKRTQDELGIGSIRDAFAEMLFPGTSTIQTRARYFLFIPWMYQDLVRRRTHISLFAAYARRQEISLIKPLIESQDLNGIIGRVSQGGLQRLPSNIYWSGLASWGIRRFSGSQEAFHRSADEFEALYQAPHKTRKGDDGDWVTPWKHFDWDPNLPAAPANFPKKATFQLTRAEAEYLRDRILISHQDSFLAFLVSQGKQTSQVAFPWGHPQGKAT
jgi:Family of unknown function (DUF6361)